MSKIAKMMAAAKQRGDFETVCEHYGCTADEITEMREIANRDKQAALECFAFLDKKNQG
jgi:hypothetical protein